MKFQLILPQDLRGALDASVSDWTSKGNVERLFQKDATLWTGTDEAKWLGWTDIVARQHADLAKYAGLAADIHASGDVHVYHGICGKEKGRAQLLDG